VYRKNLPIILLRQVLAATYDEAAFNNKYTQYNEVSVFSKLGTVNAEQVFFIVSGSTASAANY
jgi:hypothetical protein